MKAPQIHHDFKEFIVAKDHPCVMAQTVFKMDQVELHRYKEFGSEKTASAILTDLKKYLAHYNFSDRNFFTFIATFPNKKDFSEKDFEAVLWRQLQVLHEKDNKQWDPTVSTDSENNNFSFSLLGKAFYIVGMHPNSSRKSRRSPVPTMVFNLHDQFEKLREMGAYKRVRNKIRQRDEALQGSINPMLKDFGDESEARQYSDRKVGKNWKCPFHT